MPSVPDAGAAAADGSAGLAAPADATADAGLAALDLVDGAWVPAGWGPKEQGRAALEFYTESVTVYEDA